MEVFFFFLIMTAGFLLLLAPLIALVRASRAAKLSRRSQDEVKRLGARLDALEREIRLREASSPQAGPPKAAVTALPAGAPAVGKFDHKTKAEKSRVERHIPPIESWIGSQRPQPSSQPPGNSISKSQTGKPAAAPTPPSLPIPATGMSLPKVVPSLSGERFSSRGLEEALGTNWLNKLGVVILVIGVALFVGYKLRTLGPGGKDFVGFLVAAAMLGAGIYFERREPWKALARAGIGGGWALAFFVAYAMRHVRAARVLGSNGADLALLLVVGAAMVAHTLKYRSETVTGLAFLLAFLTVNANRGDLSGLYANAVLVAGITVIAVSLHWYELEIFGILAAFFSHYYWLKPFVAPLPHPHGEFPGYRLSSGLLTFYWLAFLASYVVRRVRKALEEHFSAVAMILNSGLFVWLMGYQSAHPEKSFEFFLVTGAVEFAAGQLPMTRRRRAAFIVLTLIGSGLMVAAFPFKFSHQSLSVLWVLLAETLFLAGMLLRETVFRRAGMAVAFLASFQIIIADTRQVILARSAAYADIPLPHLAILFIAAALILYFNAHFAARLRPELAGRRFDIEVFRVGSCLAALLAVFGVWVACSEQWMAVGWAGLGLVLVYAGFRGKAREVTMEGYAVAVLAILRASFANLAASPHWHGVSLRPVTVLTVVALLYLSSRWAAGSDAQAAPMARRIPAAYTWSASLLAALVLWYELQTISVALGWTLFGLVLLEFGMWRKSGALRWQACAAFLASFARIFFVNLNAAGSPGQLSPRVFTVVPLALAFYYASDRLERSKADFLALDCRFRMPAVLNYLSILTLAALIRFELDPDWVIVGWSTLVLALLATARRTERRIFLHQGLILSFAVFFRGVGHNFYERSYFPAAFWSWYSRPLCVGAAIAILFIALAFAFKLRGKAGPGIEAEGRLARFLSALGRRPDQVLFFIAVILLTVLLALEMRKGMVTVAWGVEAVSVFLFALAVAERSFRLTGLGLLLLCAGKIVVFDFWEMSTPDKILTAMVIGSALYGVSYLYTRYREALSQYL